MDKFGVEFYAVVDVPKRVKALADKGKRKANGGQKIKETILELRGHLDALMRAMRLPTVAAATKAAVESGWVNPSTLDKGSPEHAAKDNKKWLLSLIGGLRSLRIAKDQQSLTQGVDSDGAGPAL